MLGEPSLTIEPFTCLPAPKRLHPAPLASTYLLSTMTRDGSDLHDDSAELNANSNVVPLRTAKEASTSQNAAPQRPKAPQKELIKVSADLLDNLVNPQAKPPLVVVA